jgi:FkbM family methyltransferase
LKHVIYTFLQYIFFRNGVQRTIDGENFRFPIEFARFYPSNSEPLKTNFILDHARGNALDLGAHIGLFTVLLARKCELVIAVEPIEATRTALARTLTMNECNNVLVVNQCVSDFNGKGVIFDTGSRGSNANSIAPIGVPLEKEMRTIDSFDMDFDFIKIDIEGAEVRALRGAKRTLANVHYMTIEIHPKLIKLIGDNVEEVFELLDQYRPIYFHEGIKKTPSDLMLMDTQYELNIILNKN